MFPRRKISCLDLESLSAVHHRLVPEAGGRDEQVSEAVYHGREDRTEELRSFRFTGETRSADQQVPADGGDGLPAAGDEGMCFCRRGQV